MTEFGDEHGGHALIWVQRSASTASRVARGSNDSDGSTMVAPRVTQATLDMTIPKQW